jgi:hypothetical protein
MTVLTGSFFYIPCDTVFFNLFAKAFFKSAKRYAPEINVHCHLFDATSKDINWCSKNGISLTTEITPINLSTAEEKRAFWVNIRFCRITDIFDDASTVMALDADSVVVNCISLEQFSNDIETDWVTIRPNGRGALGGCVAFAPFGQSRHELRKRLEEQLQSFEWFLDQRILNDLIKEDVIGTFSTKYLDCAFTDQSKIWSGKGKTKYYNLDETHYARINRFANEIALYNKPAR